MDAKSIGINLHLSEYYESVKGQFPLRKMLLFGSHAKGLANEDSDIDIAVIVDRIPGMNRIEITTRLFLLAAKLNTDIEPKCIFWDEYLNPEPATILSEILRTAKEIEA